jgi:hypothetical protein
VFENATEVFHCLSSPCDNLTQSEIGVLEEFAVIMYDRSSSTNKDLLARKQRPYNGILPSRAALVEHIKRSDTGCSGLIGRKRPKFRAVTAA